MPRDKDKRHQEIRKTLTQLDLYHHSLSNVGQRLVSEVAKPPLASSGALYERALHLSTDCLRIIHDLCDDLDDEHLDSCHSTLDQLNLSIRKASRAKTPTLSVVHLWRVVETTEQFLVGIAEKYDYERMSEETALDAIEGREGMAAELASLFEEYAEIMATKIDLPRPAGPPFSHGIIRWRGSQLFYVQRVEDGTRWIELDPDYERESVVDEEEAVELARARTIEGYPIRLRLDLMVEEHEVDNYILSQQGSEYFVSGSQIAQELKRRSARKVRRR